MPVGRLGEVEELANLIPPSAGREAGRSGGGWSTLFKPITPSSVKIGIGLN